MRILSLNIEINHFEWRFLDLLNFHDSDVGNEIDKISIECFPISCKQSINTPTEENEPSLRREKKLFENRSFSKQTALLHYRSINFRTQGKTTKIFQWRTFLKVEGFRLSFNWRNKNFLEQVICDSVKTNYPFKHCDNLRSFFYFGFSKKKYENSFLFWGFLRRKRFLSITSENGK